MSANYSDPVIGAGAGAPLQPEGSQVRPETALADGNVWVDPQQAFREYVSPGMWTVPAAPPPPHTPQPVYPPGGFYQPVYPGQAPVYPGYGAYPGYPGYGYYAWPQQPKRDRYLLVIGIMAFVCSGLVIVGGLGSLAIIALVSIAPNTASLPSSTYFAGIMLFLTFALAGIVGGAFCGYHSIRSLFFRKPSRAIWLPRFWIFLLCYLATLGLGFWLDLQGQGITSPPLTGLLIYLGAVFPALTILALGIRRLRFPKIGQWPTTWRRLTLALVSGATLSIGLALILEALFQFILLGTQGNGLTQYISDPNSGNPPPSLYGVLLLMLSVVAPVVEELVKPLAVVLLIGRVRSKAEAFALGLACGIGFNLVETTGYISSGYNDWLNVALVRSGAGLLHGFGAGMMALGWYYLTHRQEGSNARRVGLAIACAGYAFIQHAVWNGTVGLAFLPGPIGNFFQNWSWMSIDGIELANIVEVICILIFFIYMAGRLRTRPDAASQERSGASERGMQPTEGAYITYQG